MGGERSEHFTDRCYSNTGPQLAEREMDEPGRPIRTMRGPDVRSHRNWLGASGHSWSSKEIYRERRKRDTAELWVSTWKQLW